MGSGLSPTPIVTPRETSSNMGLGVEEDRTADYTVKDEGSNRGSSRVDKE